MAGTKISDLPSASTLTGAELVPVVQSDVTKKTTVTDILTSAGAGTVTSVNVSGGTTGLTATGGPVTTSGTITLGGTLDVDNGGTGATTAANARTNLGAAASGTNADITSMTGVTGGISTPDFIQFDTAAGATTAVAKEYWDDNSGGLSYGMKGGNVTQNTGQQTYQRVYNTTGATIAKGSVVYVTGSSGTRITVAKAQATADATSATVLGVTAEAIANNSEGFVLTQGEITNISTTGISDGALLWLSPSVAGAFTSTKPTAPDHLVLVGYCIKGGSGGAGIIYVKMENGYELGELHDVYVSSPTNGQTLIYNETNDRWENHNLTAGSGITITNGAGSITIASSAGGGSVTSVNASGGTTGMSFSGGPITTSGTLTLAGTLDVDNGGTGQTSYTNGQLLIGNSAGGLTKATLTAGTNISITNGNGSITIAASGSAAGDVVGPSSATDSAVVLYDGTTGKLIKSQGIVTMSPYTVTAGTFQSTMFGPTLDKGVIGVGAVFPVNGTAGAYKSYGVYQIGAPGKNASTSTIDEAYAYYNESGAAENTAVTKYFHYTAKQGTIVSGGSITSQTGFYAHNALIGATNNYGFVSEIPVGGTNWNIYASGDAQNYFAGNVGIGKNNPSSALDVKGTIRLSGSTSGYVGLAPAAAAGSTTYTLPSADGTNGQVLKTDGTGTLSWTSVGGTGTVTSIDVSGGTTGLTTSGGPVTGSGTITLAGTLDVDNGGTGQVTQQAAINALAGAQTSGYYLRGNGTNVSMSAIQAGDVPTLNQNTTGSAGSVANALTINNSGTGDASGSTYNGSAAKTISYNSIGASPLAGSSSLTTVGTIGSGTWQGSTIAVGYGGTGATTLTGYVKGNGTSAFTASSTVPGSDVSGNISGNAANVTGTVAVANGGTGLTSGTSGGVLYYSAAGTLASSAALAANALVVGGGAGVAPSTVTTGTGVVTALGVNTGTAGAFVVNGGALGTPSSGTVTNLTGTASININGTVGATTPTTGAFTTVAASSTVTLSGLTASTALALDASKNVVSVTNTGSGNNVLATSPTLTTPILGTPTSGNLSNCTADGTNNVGYRNIPQSGSDKTTSYTLATTDVGKFIGVGTSGSIVVPNSTFATGDVVSIFNNTTGNVTITTNPTSSYIAGTNTTKASMTLATRGVATVLFISGTVCVVSGNVS